jgi:hypothetical protein
MGKLKYGAVGSLGYFERDDVSRPERGSASSQNPAGYNYL